MHRWQTLIGALIGFTGLVITIYIAANNSLAETKREALRESLSQAEQTASRANSLQTEISLIDRSLCSVFQKLSQPQDFQNPPTCPGKAVPDTPGDNPLDVGNFTLWSPAIAARSTIEGTYFFANRSKLDVLDRKSMAAILNFYTHVRSLNATLEASISAVSGDSIDKEWAGLANQLKNEFARVFESTDEADAALRIALSEFDQTISMQRTELATLNN